MNLLLKFEATNLRDEFVRRLRAQHPEVLNSYSASKSLPHAVVGDIDAIQADWVREAADGLGRVFDDITFEPFKKPEGE